MTDRMAGRLATVALLALPCALLPRPAWSQCTPFLPFFTGIGTASTINLVYSGANPLVGQGAAMWNGTCGDEIPTFAVRPQGMAGGVNVTVNVVNGTLPSAKKTNVPAPTSRRRTES